MNKWRLTIEADTNDADYVRKSHDFTDKEWQDEYKPIIEKIVPALIANSQQPLYNWWDVDSGGKNGPKRPYELYVEGGILTEEEFDYFNEVVPHFEGGVHSITGIELTEIGQITKYL